MSPELILWRGRKNYIIKKNYAKILCVVFDPYGVAFMYLQRIYELAFRGAVNVDPECGRHFINVI